MVNKELPYRILLYVTERASSTNQHKKTYKTGLLTVVSGIIISYTHTLTNGVAFTEVPSSHLELGGASCMNQTRFEDIVC